jgi:hypothetical protein
MALDLYSIATGSDEQANADAQTLARALRTQKGMAILGGLSQSPAARAQSPLMIKDASAQEDRLSEMPRQRLTQSLLGQQASKIQEETADRHDPALRDLYSSFARNDDAGTAAAAKNLRAGNFPAYAALEEKRRAAMAGDATKQWVAANTQHLRNQMQDQTDEKAVQIGDAILKGQQQPEVGRMGRYVGPVRAYLASKGYDLAHATNEWSGMQKYLAAANGPSQVRMQAAIGMIPQQTAKIRSLWNEWKQEAAVSGIKQFNRAQLFAAKQTGGKLGALANALDAQIADLTSELGFVYTGGTAPTDHSFKLAGQNLNSQWDDQSVQLALKNIDDAAVYRRNAMGATVPMGTAGQNRYDARGAGGQAAPAPVAAAPAAGPVNMRRPDGRTGPVSPDKVEAAKKAGYRVVP